MHSKMRINEARFPYKFLARRIHRSLAKTPIEIYCLSRGLWLIHMALQYHTTSVVHEYGAGALLRKRSLGSCIFCIDSIRGKKIFGNNFSSPPAM